MRTAHRILAVSVLSLPLVIGAASTASAATPDNIPSVNFDSGVFAVGPNGSALQVTDAQFGPCGSTFLTGAVAVGAGGVAGTATETGISVPGQG
ncbi:hypothetical protein [Kitasatospora sp. NBC_01300]|uniref:hypothetical protein n=1 Tax=Kitasatospora sp. NBC_01300 TaxID=2903574 RepID=UPI002F917AC0|nr:hypothetical protein OG556_35515 [Kitasatospora sp. NBC_01300]